MEKKNNLLTLILIVTVSILIGVICMLNVNAKNSNEESLANYELPLLGNESFEEKLNRELASKKSNEDLIYSEVKYVEEIEEIDFSTEYVTDKDMYKDQSKVITEGIKGKELIGYLVKTEYSKDVEKEVDKSIRNSIVIEEPTTKVVKVGTKERPNLIPGTSYQYKKVFSMKATAYSAQEPGNVWGYATAYGIRAQAGVIAVDPKVIPLGTKVYVTGYGFAIAADTGSAIKGNIIDVYIESVKQCNQWGRRNVTVYILQDQSVNVFKMR